MKLIKMYSDAIITPLEKEVKKLRIKVYSKKFSFTRRTDKECLAKMENMLRKYYKKLAILADEEIKFNNEIEKKSNRNN